MVQRMGIKLGFVFVLVCIGVLLAPTVVLAAQSAEGFNQSWMCLGPYSNDVTGATPGPANMRSDFLTDGAGIIERTLIPTVGQTINTDFSIAASSAYVSRPGNGGITPTVILWNDPDAWIDYNVVYVAPSGGNNDNMMAYAWAYARNKTGAILSCYIGCGSDDSLLVKVNGMEVGNANIARGSALNQVQSTWAVTLLPGDNLVMIKTFNGGGGFNFSARFQTTNALGNPVTAANAVPIAQVEWFTAPQTPPYQYPPMATADRLYPGPCFYDVGVPYKVTVVAAGANNPSPVLTETAPAGWTFIGAPTVTQGTAGTAGGTMTWNVGPLATTASVTYTMSPTGAGDVLLNGQIVTGGIPSVVSGPRLVRGPSGPLGTFEWKGNIGSPPVGATGGDPSTPGGAIFMGNTYTLSGSGSDVWTTLDRCQIAVKRMNGDFAIQATIQWTAAPPPGDATWTKAGVMVRKTLYVSDSMWNTGIRSTSQANLIIWQGHPLRDGAYVEGGDAGGASTFPGVQPERVMLLRRGTVMTAYRFVSGAWVQQGLLRTCPDMAGPEALACLFVTSHSNGVDATANFTDVQILPLPVIAATRTITPSTTFTSQPMTVRIAVQMASPSNPLIVGERFPAGFTASNPNPAGAVIAGNTISWTLPNVTADTQVTYNLTAPTPFPVLTQMFSGVVTDYLSVPTAVGGDYEIVPVNARIYQQGRFPNTAYVGASDAHIILYQNGVNNNGASYFIEEGDNVGTGIYSNNTDGKMPFLRFNLDGIPAGSTIYQAKLKIFHWRNRTVTQAAHTVYASKVLKDWGEGVGGDQDGRVAIGGEVNWRWARFNQLQWQMGGARGPTDIAPNESNAQVSTSTINTWIEWDVTQMARDWANNPFANFGLKLHQDPTVGSSTTMWVRGLPDFYSRNYTGDITLRPQLGLRAYVAQTLNANRWELYR